MSYSFSYLLPHLLSSRYVADELQSPTDRQIRPHLPPRAARLMDGHRLPRPPRAAVAWASPPPPSPNPAPTPRRRLCLCRSPRGASTAPLPPAYSPCLCGTKRRTCPTRSSGFSSRRPARLAGVERLRRGAPMGHGCGAGGRGGAVWGRIQSRWALAFLPSGTPWIQNEDRKRGRYKSSWMRFFLSPFLFFSQLTKIL